MDDKGIGVIATTVSNCRGALHDRKEASGDSKEKPPASSKNSFERYINKLAINNFGFTLQTGWEGVGLTFQFAWLNGGPAAVVYGSIIAGIGSTLVATALGEMASIWSARFAQRAPEFWGFIQGWITVIAWICNCAAAMSVSSNTMTGLIVFNNPSYEPKAWHATLFLIGFIIVPVLLNFALRRIINYLETIGAICHVIFFIGIISTLGALAKRSNPGFVFKTLHIESGWTNPGVAFSIGMLGPAFSVSSFDGVLHMIDETKEPRKQVPRAMFFATSSNAIMMMSFGICLMFCIGDAEAVSSSMLPIAEVFYSATGSRTASTILVLMMAGVCMVSNFNVVASVSRLVWAFARDKGLPFHQYFTYVHPRLQVPLPALVFVGAACCLLSLINLGSAQAFNALIALPTIALYISYIIPITLLLLRQLAGKHPKYGPWHLGRWSIPIKACALLYLVYVAVFVPFPASRPVTNLTMNYAAPIFICAVLLALMDWFVRGRKKFDVPTLPLEFGEDG